MCGLPGQSLGEAGCIPGRVTMALASCSFCNRVHMVQKLILGVAAAPSSFSPVQRQRSESWGLQGFIFLFLIASPLSQESLADFHWILNFKFENKMQKAFISPFFKPLKLILLYLCDALSFTSSDLILPTNLRPWLGEQELLFVFSV